MIGAIGMLAGFCGTLMTPMAANFNIVPAALLELKDQIRRHQGAGRDRAAAARRQHPAHLFRWRSDDASPHRRTRRRASPRIALGHVTREYPHKLDHVLDGPTRTRSAPRALHPIFFGSFDWHSCVHG